MNPTMLLTRTISLLHFTRSFELLNTKVDVEIEIFIFLFAWNDFMNDIHGDKATI